MDATSPSGEIQASTDPRQLHKKIKLKGQIKLKESQVPETPLQISAKLPDNEPVAATD